MKLSVIIPAFNEEEAIGTLLKSLVAQTVLPYEIIVVDNNSTDNTVKTAKSYNRRLPLRIIKEKQAGAGYARNTGARVAKGDFMLFTDADTILPPHIIERVTEFLIHHRYSVALVPSRMPSKQLGLLLGAHFMNAYVRLMRHTPWPIGFTCYCIRHQEFNAVHGFNPTIAIMEDYDLIYRLHRHGAKIGYVKNTHFFTSDRRFIGKAGKQRMYTAFRAEIYRYTHKLSVDNKKFTYKMGGSKSSKK